MKRRNTKLSRLSHSFPEDEWTDQVKVCLYRLDHSRRPRFLTTYLTIMFTRSMVAAEYGDGEYLLIVSRNRRVLRRGILAIEGSPI